MTAADDGLPLVARSARALGVRVEGEFRDVELDPEGRVIPGRGGLSVAPSAMWNIPNHRRPRGMGRGSTGPVGDRVFSLLRDHVLRAGLVVRDDPVRPTKHAFIEPVELLELARYEMKLAGTRNDWKQVWP